MGAEGDIRITANTQAGYWTAASLLMALCAVAVAWFPLFNIASLPSVNYNEGWNAYRQWMTVEHQPLYGSATSLWTTNYPFLSFHIIGLLAGAKGHMVVTGRIVCFAALVATAGVSGAIMRGVTDDGAAGLYAGLWLFAALGAFNGAGRACDDPEMLGTAIACFGIFAYLRGAGRGLWYGVSAIAFAVSLFTKHDLIGFALSAGLHLLITRNWRGLAVFMAAGVLASGVLLALSLQFDGRYFFADLVQPRAYGWRNLRAETLHYLLHFAVALVIGLVVLWRCRAVPGRGFFIILLVTTNIIAIGFSGGDGVAANIFYPALIADLLACVTALYWLRAGRYFKAALIAVTLSGAVMAPFQIENDIAAQARLPGATAAARQAIALLAAAKGPAICEDLALCYEAGKPMDYDPYYVSDQIRIGRLPESRVLAMLTARHYGAIQMDGAVTGVPRVEWRNARFSKAFLRVLAKTYRPVLVTRYDTVFVPRGAAQASATSLK